MGQLMTFNEKQIAIKIREILGKVIANNRNALTENFEEALKEIEGEIDFELSETVNEYLRKEYKKQVRKQMRMMKKNPTSYNYNLIDSNTLTALSQQNIKMIVNLSSKVMNDYLKKNYSETLDFIVQTGEKKETIEAMQAMIKGIQPKLAQYSNTIVQTSGTMVRALAGTNALEKAGVTKYTYIVVKDSVTTEICQSLIGKVVEIERAIEQRDAILAIEGDGEQVRNQLKAISPMIKVTEDGFEANGITYTESEIMDIPGVALPPFHYGCRTEIRIL